MMHFKQIAGWVFRIYLVVLLVGILALGVAWSTGRLAGTSEMIGTIWYGIAGFGTVTLLVLVAARVRAKDPTEPLF